MGRQEISRITKEWIGKERAIEQFAINGQLSTDIAICMREKLDTLYQGHRIFESPEEHLPKLARSIYYSIIIQIKQKSVYAINIIEASELDMQFIAVIDKHRFVLAGMKPLTKKEFNIEEWSEQDTALKTLLDYSVSAGFLQKEDTVNVLNFSHSFNNFYILTVH